MKKKVIIGIALAIGVGLGAAIPWESWVSLTTSDIVGAERIVGLEFSAEEREMMLPSLQSDLEAFAALRSQGLDNAVMPAVQFDPLPIGWTPPQQQREINWTYPKVPRPATDEEIAYLPVPALAGLLRSGDLTSVELTQIYLNRIAKYSDTLQCTITVLSDEALAAAAKADEELAAGQDRGPLHGIPYGVKDLLAYPGTKTTWGAEPYKDQELDVEATVISKLKDAGGVLVAKLTLGALAMGDVWYGGITRNPWNLEVGSSGSSAGSASATVAGLVGFSIGTETLGSIVSPSTRCGASGLRPTYGRVSRYGAMALSWTMDKIGPICRSAEGAAMVFAAIQGADPMDPTLIPAAYNYQQEVDLSQLRIGYFEDLFSAESRPDGMQARLKNDLAVLDVFRELGVEVEPIALLDSVVEVPVEALSLILTAEAAAAFDDLTRSDLDSLLVRQTEGAWPNIFRSSRFMPAVEYIQANRFRRLLTQQVHTYLQDYDVVITPSFGGMQLLATNLTGHPVVVVPNGFDDNGANSSISFLGNLFDEASILAAAKAYQEATEWDDMHPELPE